jgi:RNA polymerase sigma-70 factor (ECF subfamily)
MGRDDLTERNDWVASIGVEPEAFERFYRSHVDAVEHFVARRTDDPFAVADLTASVFVAAIESADMYRPSRGEPRAWLFGIAWNVVMGERRRSAREWRAVGRLRGRDLVADGDIEALVRRIDAERSARDLWADLARLPASERVVLELVALDGLSVGETAVALGIGPVAARVRLHRARRAMRSAAANGTGIWEVSS